MWFAERAERDLIPAETERLRRESREAHNKQEVQRKLQRQVTLEALERERREALRYEIAEYNPHLLVQLAEMNKLAPCSLSSSSTTPLPTSSPVSSATTSSTTLPDEDSRSCSRMIVASCRPRSRGKISPVSHLFS